MYISRCSLTFLFIRHLVVKKLYAARKRFYSVLSKHKLDLAIHILVVYSLAFLVIYSPSGLRRLLVEPASSELLQQALPTDESVQDSAGSLDVVILNEDGSCEKWSVTHL